MMPIVERLTTNEVMVVSGDDFTVLGEKEFGMPGIRATEVIGPFVRTQAVGPLIMLHEGVIDPHHGIGHHPHRTNERLFYMLAGALDHDDSLNGITGHMGRGDVGLLTEGRIGMFHKEWNNTDETARAFILVYGTDPMPERASFEALRDGDAPRYEEGEGARTKELVGARSPLRVHGDIRFFGDTVLEPGSDLEVRLGQGEGAVLAPMKGEVTLDGRALTGHDRALLPPGEARSVAVRATAPSRVLRVTFGPGHGLVVQEPRR
jgi:redox-sensitive bicupin YhaK (pirin superfamily)